MKIALFLIGYGNVAQRFVRLLDESKQYLDGLGIEPRIVAVITRSHGRAVNLSAGLDHATLADSIARDAAVEPEPLRFLDNTLDDFRAENFPVRALVETIRSTSGRASRQLRTSARRCRAAFTSSPRTKARSHSPIAAWPPKRHRLARPFSSRAR